jgi:hypothetical protein
MNKTYRHLDVNERVHIQFLLGQGFKVRVRIPLIVTAYSGRT